MVTSFEFNCCLVVALLVQVILIAEIRIRSRDLGISSDQLIASQPRVIATDRPLAKQPLGCPRLSPGHQELSGPKPRYTELGNICSKRQIALFSILAKIFKMIKSNPRFYNRNLANKLNICGCGPTYERTSLPNEQTQLIQV